MKKCAFVTYNAVGEGLSNGWHESNGRRALVLQNTRGCRWAVDQFAERGTDDFVQDVVDVRGEIEDLWSELQQVLPEIDHVVIYVGSDGSERAIELAAELPASKVTFVGCDCGISYKVATVQAAGLSDARLFRCECGGHQTMMYLYENFMETGNLLITKRFIISPYREPPSPAEA